MQEQKDAGVAAYPHKFHVSISITDFLKKYHSLKNEETSETPVSIAGRIHSIRESSQKLRFYDVRGEGVKLQVNFINLF